MVDETKPFVESVKDKITEVELQLVNEEEYDYSLELKYMVDRFDGFIIVAKDNYDQSVTAVPYSGSVATNNTNKTVNQYGTFDLVYLIEDVSGNQRFITIRVIVKDETPPIPGTINFVGVTENVWSNKRVTFTITGGSDDSGVFTIFYSFDQEVWTQYVSQDINTISLPVNVKEGKNNFYL